MSSDNYSVEVKNLVVKFKDFIAVNHLSFSVDKGEVFGFLGSNGAGKTTTIRVLCGLHPPDAGSVVVAGINLKTGVDLIKSKIGYMSQKTTVYDDLTIKENIDFIARLRKIPHCVYKQRLEELIEFISLTKPLSTLTKTLPKGIRNQVSLVGALIHDPDLIFLDEPTSGVSPVYRARFWLLIKYLSKKGKTIFITSHHMDEVKQCDRIAFLRKGSISKIGKPEELKDITFKGDFIRLIPKEKYSLHENIYKMNQSVFRYWERFGDSYHASVRDKKLWLKLRDKFAERYHIYNSSPSLEDVFIYTYKYEGY